ncbi:MAG: DUF4382 domain-containing protein [Olleya sp.]
MTFLKTNKTLLFSFLFLALLNSCSKELETETFENSSLINIKLKGTPSQFNEADIELLNVQFRVMEDPTDPNAWINVNPNALGTHDIASYINDQTIILADFEEFPAKYIYDIRLEVGFENSVKKNGIIYPVNIDTEYRQGFSNIIKKQLDANKVYEFLIEIDVDKSITFYSNNEAYLTPKMSTNLRTFELF